MQHKIKHHWFKPGDIIAWTPKYARTPTIEKRGVGIVLEADGPFFEAFWIGDSTIRKEDVRWNLCKLSNLNRDLDALEIVKEKKRNIKNTS